MGPISAAGYSVRADQTGAESLSRRIDRFAEPSSLFRRSICHRTDAALSSRPIARTHWPAGKFEGSPTVSVADGLRTSRATGREPEMLRAPSVAPRVARVGTGTQ